jgi:hypothetical protein
LQKDAPCVTNAERSLPCRKEGFLMRCCTGDGGLMAPRSRPRGVASSRLMLRWLKTVVVSDEEKAHVMRQAGTRKTTAVQAS